MPRRLQLTDKAVELMAYLAMHNDGMESNEQIARALWPGQPASQAMQLLHATVAEVNDTVARQTGKPVPAIPTADVGHLPPELHPRLLVRVIGEPYVEVYDDHEPFPGWPTLSVLGTGSSHAPTTT